MKYPTITIRLKKETIEKLQRLRNSKVWDKFINELIDSFKK